MENTDPMSTDYQQTPLTDELDAFFAQYTAANQSKALVYGLVGPAGLVHSTASAAPTTRAPP